MEPVDRLQEILSPLPAVRLAVLFGSFAKDRARRGSDVDLGVVLDPDDHETRLEVEVAVGRALRRDIDLVDLRRAPPLLRFEVSRDGILLVEREPGSWIRFRARAMLDWWDWKPIARIFHGAAVGRLRSQLSGSA